MSKTIKVSDKIGESLESLASSEGNTMAAEISILIAEHNMAKQICERLSGVERALNKMQVYKPEPVVVPAVSPVASPATVTYETYEKSDKTYDEFINELRDLQEEYNELDDKNSDRGKELVNKMRAINVDLSLIDEE